MHQSVFKLPVSLLLSLLRLICSGSTQPVTKLTALFMICVCGAIPQAVAEELIVRSMSEIESGTLLFPSENRNYYHRAPIADTSVQIGVQGLLARAIVEQTFTNQSSQWVEGIYAFPLPDDASVDELSMIIGDTKIDGVIQPRRKAQRTYEAAKRSGKKASLLEQQRPNLFTTRIANIPPGESISVRIAYQSNVRYSDGRFSLYFPLTITPRYIPGQTMRYANTELDVSTGGGWAAPTDSVSDADKITPPMTDTPSPVSINVSLDTGLPNLTIASSTHDIISTPVNSTNKNTWDISLANGLIPADKDFKLTWTPQATTAPVAAVFRQDKKTADNVESFASLMLMPPQQIFNDTIPPREIIFVIDTSQSMSGNSIIQARKTLALGIERLTTNDTFNVIEFDNDSHKLFNNSVTANDTNKARALRWVEKLAADGGTEILGAMVSALDSNSTDNRIKQIVFVTDGSVGNEHEIFTYLSNNIGSAKLFTVGIGSAPNMWFMRKSAELGRGTYTHIANTLELVDKTLLLLAKLERPALTDISVSFKTDTAPEIYPKIIPDVYMGEPVLADARWTENLQDGDIEITGKYGGQEWSQTIKLGTLAKQTGELEDQTQGLDNTQGLDKTRGLDKQWAARKIQSLEDNLLFTSNYEEVEQAVTDIALTYGLVTKYTSLVAVEERVSRDPSTNDIHTAALPQAIPSGNTMLYPQGSLGTTIRYLISLVLAILAVLIALPRLRQPNTSVVCTPLKSKRQPKKPAVQQC